MSTLFKLIPRSRLFFISFYNNNNVSLSRGSGSEDEILIFRDIHREKNKSSKTKTLQNT